MADLGRALVSVIIRDGDLTSAMEAGIRTSWFEHDDHARAFKWMLSYYERYGEVPTARALKQEFPVYRLLRLTEPYDYYTDKFRRQHQRAILIDGMIAADEALNIDDPDEAQAALSRALIRAGVEVSRLSDGDVVEDLPGRYRGYKERKHFAGKITGVPTGFPTLDAMTGGFHPQQFIVIGGQPKQGKSFIMLRSSLAAQDAGCKALYISFEQSAMEQLARYDAIRCGINANDLIRGTLTHEDFKRLKVGFRDLADRHSYILSTDISATTTISGLAGKIEQHKPDVLYVDGMYLMDNETGAPKDSTQHFMSISRGLKRLAQRADIPVVGVTQALSSKMAKGVVTMHSLGWTSAWSQDADLILGTEKVEVEGNSRSNLVRLRVVGGRNVSGREITLQTNWDESIIEEAEETFSEDDD
jgi:replicative DNA helicase